MFEQHLLSVDCFLHYFSFDSKILDPFFLSFFSVLILLAFSFECFFSLGVGAM